MVKAQRGVSLLSLLVVGILVALVAVVGMQVFPTVVEFQTISKAAQEAANRGSTVAEIRKLFDKAASVQYFEAVTGKDLEIGKENDKIVVSFAYEKEIHLVGPAYLVMKYEGHTQ